MHHLHLTQTGKHPKEVRVIVGSRLQSTVVHKPCPDSIAQFWSPAPSILECTGLQNDVHDMAIPTKISGPRRLYTYRSRRIHRSAQNNSEAGTHPRCTGMTLASHAIIVQFKGEAFVVVATVFLVMGPAHPGGHGRWLPFSVALAFSGWAINVATQGHYHLYTGLTHKRTTTPVSMLHRWGPSLVLVISQPT